MLPGVSRQTVIDLAKAGRHSAARGRLDLYDAYNADEVFLTSTSLCICPVTKVNGVDIGPKGQVWGPVTGASPTPISVSSISISSISISSATQIGWSSRAF